MEDALELAWSTRRTVLQMLHDARASHAGSCLSCIDILAALYAPESGWLRHRPGQDQWEGRDRFIMSKGHAAAALYATLAQRDFFPMDWLGTYCTDGARLGGHCTSQGVPGVELSTGSLGHGLPVGLGVALGLKAQGSRVAVLLGDGELNEGSNWEAILLAPRLGLDNLVAVVDYNKIQSFGRVDEVIPLGPLADKWRSFGWWATEVDGHDVEAIAAGLRAEGAPAGQPRVVIAHTVKGKGVDFMEDKLAWHYKSPDEAQLVQALAQVDAQYKEARGLS
jgi:transketolase